MASILDQAILFGKESTYATAVALTHAYEGKADSWQREHEHLESVGFRAGMHTMRSDRRKAIDMGGTGSMEIDVLNKGMGFLLQATLGTVAGPVQQGATTAYKSTASSDSAEPGDSYTVQVLRVDTGGTARAFTHAGCVLTGWSLSQEVGGLLTMSMDFDFATVVTDTAAGTPTYPASTVPFDWSQAVVTIGGSNVDATSFELSADLGLKTDRRFLRGSTTKKTPVRSSAPEFTGTIDMEFEDLTEYGYFVAATAGTTYAVTATWTGSQIQSPHNHEVKVTLPAVQFEGSSPVASLDDVGTISLPFRVLHNGTDPAVRVEYTSTDTTL